MTVQRPGQKDQKLKPRKLVAFRLRPEVYRVLYENARARGVSVRQVLEEIIIAHIEPIAATVAAQEGSK